MADVIKFPKCAKYVPGSLVSNPFAGRKWRKITGRQLQQRLWTAEMTLLRCQVDLENVYPTSTNNLAAEGVKRGVRKALESLDLMTDVLESAEYEVEERKREH